MTPELMFISFYKFVGGVYPALLAVLYLKVKSIFVRLIPPKRAGLIRTQQKKRNSLCRPEGDVSYVLINV